MKRILVSVTNYDFNDNAVRLKNFFKDRFSTVLIDSTSPTSPEGVDFVVPNTHYPGLWNKSVELAINGSYDYLFFIASDVQFRDASLLFLCLDDVAERDDIYLWSPSLSQDSRFAFKSTGLRLSSGMRYCGVIEGFCFLARTEILEKIYPLSSEIKYGYGVDIITALFAHQEGKVVVDDRVTIYHPPRKKEHEIDEPFAQSEYRKYRTQFDFSDDIVQKLEEYEKRSSNPRVSLPIHNTISLDLGCGNHLRNPFSAAKVYGIDISPDIVGENIKSVDLNLNSIPFATSSLDFVTAYDFLGHVLKAAYIKKRLRFCFVELMNETHRVLAPGGLFLSQTSTYPSPEVFDDPTHVNVMTNKTLSYCFCLPNLHASKYGFKGKFALVYHHIQDDGKLISVMRCIK